MSFIANMGVGDGATGGGAGGAAAVLSRVPPDEPEREAHQKKVAEALSNAGIKLLLVDSVYDCYEEDPDLEWLRALKGDMVFLGWRYPRAMKWILARQDIEVNGQSRKLEILDLREMGVDEVIEKVRAFLADRPLFDGEGPEAQSSAGRVSGAVESEDEALEERRLRWYPVVDYEACVHCMECLDFCLFGVYGVDHEEKLRVVQPDACRADCPACSRVCPVGAILFPSYKTNQSIAGGEEMGKLGGFKLDLSRIFGKPGARHQAALERDRALVANGRRPAAAEKMDRLAEDFDKVEI